MVGFQLKEIQTGGGYIPFAADNYEVLTDPRFTFSQKDTLEGVVSSDSPPEIHLERIGAESVPAPIQPVITTGKQGNSSIYKFSQPLTDVKDGNYYLTVKNAETRTVSPKIHILPFYIEIRKPFGMEKSEPGSSRDNYIFVQGQEYLAARQTDRAIEYFNKLPSSLWNATSLPIIAKAYYKKGDYAKVVELLEKEEVNKEYPVLLMLANSSIELKSYPRALKYLEQLRNYEDTVEINQLLASTYLSMGAREKAETYYKRARDLKDKKKGE
jgi:tetratricopeptide (TPR) repeat protein